MKKQPAPKKPKFPPWTLGLVVLVLVGFVLLILRPQSPPPSPPAWDPATASRNYLSDSGLTFAEAQLLAQSICQTCHLFPDPGLLDKKSWQHGALPMMEQWLGLTNPPPELRANGERVLNTNLFPTAPLISQKHWQAIKDYYLATAPADPLPQTNRAPLSSGLKHFRSRSMAYRRNVPMTTMVKIDPSTRRLYVGDALTRSLEAVDPSGNRLFVTQFESSPISLTISPELLYLTVIGRLFPSDDPKGHFLEITPRPVDLKMRPLLKELRRPTDTKLADLNSDGAGDVLICQFGNLVGRLSWFESGMQDREHLISERPGIMQAELHDFNKDNHLDIICLMGQGRDGIFLFLNDGKGNFDETTVAQFHPLFGLTGFELLDFNRDGHLDLLVCNGDNGEYDSPPKNYHGIRLLLNNGKNYFEEKFFFAMNGVYKAMARDFDKDGDFDIAAISYFPDYSRTPDESFVYLENRGGLEFKPCGTPDSILGRWLTMDAGDLDGDGDIDLVLGSFLMGPTTIPIPPAYEANWKTGKTPILLLENILKP